MTFAHMTVKRLLESHERQVERVTGILKREMEDPPFDPPTMTWLREVDGLPISVHLANFCDGVRKIAPGVKFAAARTPKTIWRNSTDAICEVWAYFPGDEFAFMRLGHADYSVRDGDIKYCVYSRNISNEKFSDRREQYHVALTDSLERAVKNAKKYMRRYSPQEAATMRVNEFSDRVCSPAQTTASAATNVRHNIGEHRAFFAEMRSLVERGHQFDDPAFGDMVKDYVARTEEATAKKNRQYHGFYVNVREEFGEQMFDVIQVLDIKRANSRLIGAHVTYKAHELDRAHEELPHKLAALSMLSDHSFVEDVGHKVSDNVYWVLV